MHGTRVHDRRSQDTLAAGQYAPVEVDDPFSEGEKITVLRQLRSDPLARFHARKEIDDAQFAAGRMYERVWEKTESGARAIDPSKEKVDGGLIPECFREDRQKAAIKMSEANHLLGEKAARLLFDIVVRGMSFQTAINERGLNGQWQLRVHAKIFKDALESLARHWGYAQKPRY